MKENIDNKLKYAQLEGWISIISNILLAALKYWAGIVSGSLALIVDAWHTVTDSISSIIIIIGARISSKPADERHPFGHGRAEFISSLLVSLMLFLVAFSFIKESIINFNAHQKAEYGIVAIIVTIGSILAKEGLAQYAFYCARKSDSIALKADAWHHRSDAISSVVILIGIIFGRNIWWIDSLLGVIVALLIAYTALRLSMATISRVLGELPDPELIEHVKKIADEIALCDTQAHHFHLHDYVTHKELTFHLKMKADLNIRDAHDKVTLIEERIKSELKITATIHIEPKAMPE